MRILVGDMPTGIKGLYDYLLESKAFKLVNEGVEYDDGKAMMEVSRFSGPGNHLIELMAHSSGHQTISIYRTTQSGRVVICADIPALAEVDTFRKIYATLWGVRK